MAGKQEVSTSLGFVVPLADDAVDGEDLSFQRNSSTRFPSVTIEMTYCSHLVTVEFTDNRALGIALHDVGHLVAVERDDRFDFGPIGTLLLEFLAQLEFDGCRLQHGCGRHRVLVSVGTMTA